MYIPLAKQMAGHARTEYGVEFVESIQSAGCHVLLVEIDSDRNEERKARSKGAKQHLVLRLSEQRSQARECVTITPGDPQVDRAKENGGHQSRVESVDHGPGESHAAGSEEGPGSIPAIGRLHEIRTEPFRGSDVGGVFGMPAHVLHEHSTDLDEGSRIGCRQRASARHLDQSGLAISVVSEHHGSRESLPTTDGRRRQCAVDQMTIDLIKVTACASGVAAEGNEGRSESSGRVPASRARWSEGGCEMQ